MQCRRTATAYGELLRPGRTEAALESVFSPIWVMAKIDARAMNARRREYSSRFAPRSLRNAVDRRTYVAVTSVFMANSWRVVYWLSVVQRAATTHEGHPTQA